MKIKSRPLNWLFLAIIAVTAISWIQGRETTVSASEQTVRTIEYGLPLPWLVHSSAKGWSLSPLSLFGTFIICFSVVAIVSLINKRHKSNGTIKDAPTKRSTESAIADPSA